MARADKYRVRLLHIFTIIIMIYCATYRLDAQEVGEYSNDGLRLILTENTGYITYSSASCIGKFKGIITRLPDRITLYDLDRSLAPECIFTLTQSGPDTITIDQGFGCTAYHGAACSLSGSVERIN